MTPRLDADLVRRGLARSRAAAARAVAEGRVEVDGRPATKAAQPVGEGNRLTVADPERWVARSAHKLLAALDGFGIDPAGRVCLDIGASTGGFTQVLLDRGAQTVIALDVGHGQLTAELRHDPRVRSLERVNARDLDAAALRSLSGVDDAPSLVVVDVSFIPLRLVLPAIASVLAADGVVVVLIKPQFEVGRAGVRGGIVHDRSRRHDAARGVLRAAAEAGLRTTGLRDSPLSGASGNLEYLCALDAVPGSDPQEWESRVTALA